MLLRRFLNKFKFLTNHTSLLNRPLTTAVIAFTWALAMGTTLQLFVLPLLFPHLHAGDGLLRGGDWVVFHQVALDLAARIREDGWGQWELRPDGQAPAGIAAALYAWTGFHFPWVVLPLNGIVFALAASELHRLVRRVTNAPWAWVGAIPFIMLPSSLLIYGQLHKDVFSIAGLFLVFNGILDVGRPLGSMSIALLSGRMLGGLGLIWIVRPYLVDIALLAFWLAVTGLFLIMLVRDSRRKIVGFLAMAAVAIGAQMAFLKTVGHVPTKQMELSLSEQAVGHVPTKQVEPSVSGQASSCGSIPHWDRLPCLVGAYRRAFIHHFREAGSIIDASVEIRNMADVFEYAPRALMVGFGAPFPSDWLLEGRAPGGRIMRLAAGFEMLLAYAAYLGVALGAWLKWRIGRSAELWAILGAAGTLVFIYALATPAVGTLYRMRLGGWHTYIAIGCVFLVQMYFAATGGAKGERCGQPDRI